MFAKCQFGLIILSLIISAIILVTRLTVSAVHAIQLAIEMTVKVLALIFPIHNADSFVILGFITN